MKTGRGRDAVPACFFPTPANSYVLTDVVESKHGFAGILECSGKNRHGDGSGGDGQPPHNIGVFGSEVCPLKLVVMFEDTERVRVRITDPTTARWEVPQSLFARKVKAGTDSTGTVTEKPLYRVTYTIEPFGIAIARASTGHVVLNTTRVKGLINGLSFEQQFWQFSSEVEEDPLLFGLGQQKAPMKLPAGEAEGLDVYTLWARDPGGTPEHNAMGGSSLYGSHPFVMQVSKETGTAHGLLVRSSNALDAVLAQRSVSFLVSVCKSPCILCLSSSYAIMMNTG